MRYSQTTQFGFWIRNSNLGSRARFFTFQRVNSSNLLNLLLTLWISVINLKPVSDDSTCPDAMEWTGWNSASDANTGSDFEILADHVVLFGLVYFWVFQSTKSSKYRVCSSPSHIEARTVNEKLSWLGTDAVLIYDTTPKPAVERNWAYGISRDFG